MLGEIFKSAVMLAVLCAICSGLFVIQQLRDGKIERGGALSFAVLVIAVLSLFLLLAAHASARDLGQWDNSDTSEEIKDWIRDLKQPDNPAVSCCGEADAYWADSFEVQGDQYIAIVTDPRPDEPRMRKHVPIGSRFLVPNHKLKYDKSNPTGHGILFLSTNGFVYCYVAPGGV